MKTSEELEEAWGAMSEEQKLLAYAKAVLAGAKRRDAIPRFRRENNVGNFWYDAKVTYVYGGGER
ncbi:hypothetical protein D3C87_1801980 [compost metagenome]